MYDIIFVDAGHWMKGKLYDVWAVRQSWDKIKSKFVTTTERELNVKISKRLQEILKEKTFLDIADIGGNTNATLNAKVSYANKVLKNFKKGLYIAIHCNGNIGEVSGVETFYNKMYTDGKGLADSVNKSINEYFGISIRGSKYNEQSPEGGLYTSNVKCCSILVECGFISGDLEFLKQTDRMAEAIAHGILNYLRSTYGVK